MMRSSRHGEVEAAIERAAQEAEAIPTGWRLLHRRGTEASSLRARVEDDWLLLEAPLESAPPPHRSSPWSLVEANARLPGALKFALAPEDSGIQVRAEFPLGVGTDLASRISEVSQSYRLAEALARGKGISDEVSPGCADRSAWESSPCEGEDGLSRVCEEAGWIFTERSPERLAVDLEVGEAFCQALLESGAGGDVTASVELEESEPATELCREALAIFLLRAGGWLRMVRFAADVRSDRVVPRFEVAFATHPSPGELSEALSALSVAFRFVGSEARILARSEAAAHIYLSRQAHLISAAAPLGTRQHAGRSSSKKKRTGTSGRSGAEPPARAKENTALA